MEEEKETSKCCAADRKIHDYPKGLKSPSRTQNS